MRNLSNILIISAGFFIWGLTMDAQQVSTNSPEIIMKADSDYENVFTFDVINEPALEQTVGAPEAFYDYFWEFGDGSYSFEENPTHVYKDFGNGDVLVALTNNYSNGGAPPTRPKKKRKKKDQPPPTNTTLASAWKLGDEINTSLEASQSVGMITNHSPKPGDPIVAVLSYKNNGLLGISPNLPQNGRLYLFYNEKAFSYNNFVFQESREHAEEALTEGLPPEGLTWSQSLPQETIWASNSTNKPTVDVAPQPIFSEHKDVILKAASAKYQDVLTWDFKDLQRDEVRNIFTTFLTTPEMIRDTSATINFQAVLVPENSVLAETSTLALTVQASHDPNKMYVSERNIKKSAIVKDGLVYTIKFQNIGKGPASNIIIKNEIHRSLDPTTIKVLDYYPKTIWCDQTDSLAIISCHDTLISDGLITWKLNNIYLPGRRQPDRESGKATKGWIKYSIKPKKRLKGRKLAGKSFIYFDRNAPIATNRVRTRIDKSWSLGFKAGLNNVNQDFKHLFGGIIWAPFRPRGFYNQTELLVSEEGYEYSENEIGVALGTDATGNVLLGDRVTDVNYSLVYVDLVPFQIRKNFLRFISVGAGAQLSLLAKAEENVHILSRFDQTGIEDQIQDISADVVDVLDGLKDSRFNTIEPGIFLDINAGLVIKGPSGGVRLTWKNGKRPMAGSREDPQTEVRTSIQVYFQYKL